MDVSLCVVTYNRPEDIKRLFLSLEAQHTIPDQIIIVDDSNNSQTRTIVRDIEPRLDTRVNYIHRDDGDGMTDARNVAIKHAGGDVVAFLDDDVELPSDWVAKLVDSWTAHPDAWAIGGPAFVVDETKEYVWDIYRTTENQNWLNEYGEYDGAQWAWQPPEPTETDHLIGANMSFRRDILEQLGGFNAIYRGSELYEDTDIMARIRRRGGTIIYDPELAVDHYETSKTGTDNLKEDKYWQGFNAIIFRYVCFPKQFSLSFLRLLTVNQGQLTTVWKKLGASLLYDAVWLSLLRGYLDGLVYVIRNRNSLPVDHPD